MDMSAKDAEPNLWETIIVVIACVRQLCEAARRVRHPKVLAHGVESLFRAVVRMQVLHVGAAAGDDGLVGLHLLFSAWKSKSRSVWTKRSN